MMASLPQMYMPSDQATGKQQENLPQKEAQTGT